MKSPTVRYSRPLRLLPDPRANPPAPAAASLCRRTVPPPGAEPLAVARLAAPTVDPAPMFAASIVANSSSAGRARPATKKSRGPRTRRPIHAPSATSPTEYASRRGQMRVHEELDVARRRSASEVSDGRNAGHRCRGADGSQDGLRGDVRGKRADQQQVVRSVRVAVASANTVSPSAGVCTGESRGQTRRAPSAPAWPPAVWSALALVATTASVVFSAGRRGAREGVTEQPSRVRKRTAVFGAHASHHGARSPGR